MKELKDILSNYRTTYAAGKALDIHPEQLKRWLNLEAVIDTQGRVFILTKGSVKERVKQ